MKQNVKKICNLCLVSCFSASALLSLNSCESTEPSHSSALLEEDNIQTDVALLQQKNALQTINYINWLCALVNPGELENYHFNKIDLEFAYQTLTPDSLNFRSIPDKTAVALIQDIENYILKLRIAKKDRDLLDELYKREKRKAFFAALPMNMAVIVDANWKQLLANVAQTLFYSYMNYRKIKESIEIQYQKDSWELDKDILGSIHEKNQAVLTHQWNLENDFGIDDSKRVSEEDARKLLKYVHRANSEVGEIRHVYNILKGEEDKYAYFPIYWYYRGCYAYTYEPGVKINELSREEKKDRELRIKDAQKCFEKYQDLVAGLLRKNPMLADVAVRSIQLELINSTGFLRKNFIKKQLEIIENNILLEKDEDKYLFCGLVYLKILKEPQKAVSFFEKAEGFLRMGYKDGLHDFVGELEDKTELTLENNQGLSVENASADNSKRMMPGADLLFFSRFSRYYSQIKASPEDFCAELHGNRNRAASERNGLGNPHRVHALRPDENAHDPEPAECPRKAPQEKIHNPNKCTAGVPRDTSASPVRKAVRRKSADPEFPAKPNRAIPHKASAHRRSSSAATRISVQNAAAVPLRCRAPEKPGKTPPPPQSPPHTRLHSEVNSFSSEHSIVSRYYSIKLENLQNRFIFFPAKISAGAGKFSFFPFQDLQNRIVTLYYSSCS